MRKDREYRLLALELQHRSGDISGDKRISVTIATDPGTEGQWLCIRR